MIVNNKLFKLSSMCIIGSIAIFVNQLLPSSTSITSYNEANQNGAGGVNSGYTVDVIEDSKKAKDSKEESGDSKDEETGKTEEINDESTPKDAEPEAEEQGEKKEEKEEEVDPNEIPGIDYKKYMKMADFKDLGIANVDKYLNVRKAADTGSEIIAKMPPNAGCKIKKTLKNSAGEEWCQISSGDVDGYVMKEYLILGDAAQAMVKKVGHLVIVVDCDVLNVREKADVKSNLLYKISKGEELEIVSVTRDWIEVITDIGDDTGFVSSEYVNIAYTLDKAITVDELLAGCSTERTQIVAYAKEFLGNPYVYGGTDLYKGIDCSAYTRAMYRKFGYEIHRTSREQAASDGVTISESELQPGDLVFYANSKGTVKHVAMFIGNGKIIHASNPKDGIKISNMKYTTPYRYKRIFPK